MFEIIETELNTPVIYFCGPREPNRHTLKMLQKIRVHSSGEEFKLKTYLCAYWHKCTVSVWDQTSLSWNELIVINRGEDGWINLPSEDEHKDEVKLAMYDIAQEALIRAAWVLS